MARTGMFPFDLVTRFSGLLNNEVGGASFHNRFEVRLFVAWGPRRSARSGISLAP
jgi:hypothetical protein